MYVYLTRHVVAELYEAVKRKFSDLVKSEIGYEVTSEVKLWTVANGGIELFTKYIDKKRNSIYSKHLFKKHKEPQAKEIKLINGVQCVIFKDYYLDTFLDFLDVKGNNPIEKLDNFVNISVEDEKKLDEQRNIKQEQKFDRSRLKDQKVEILELRAKLSSIMYSPILSNTSWWFYFYGYDKHRLKPSIENTWALIKLIFRFKDINENILNVEIENTDTPEHYDYAGIVDFAASRTEVIVADLKTVPFYGRQLNIKFHVGTGEGDVFLGQYLNYESDNHIIGGSLILEKIDRELFPDPEPAVHHIPILKEGEFYTEEIEGISPYILQYLSDKSQNFRRTPLRAGHSLKGLKSWLETRKIESK